MFFCFGLGWYLYRCGRFLFVFWWYCLSGCIFLDCLVSNGWFCLIVCDSCWGDSGRLRIWVYELLEVVLCNGYWLVVIGWVLLGWSGSVFFRLSYGCVGFCDVVRCGMIVFLWMWRDWWDDCVGWWWCGCGLVVDSKCVCWGCIFCLVCGLVLGSGCSLYCLWIWVYFCGFCVLDDVDGWWVEGDFC